MRHASRSYILPQMFAGLLFAMFNLGPALSAVAGGVSSEECLKLTALEGGHNQKYPPVEEIELDVDRIVSVCLDASKSDPENLDLKFSYARALALGAPREALSLLHHLSNRGHVNSTFYIGWILATGRIERSKRSDAISYFKSAANQGHLAGMTWSALSELPSIPMVNHMFDLKVPNKKIDAANAMRKLQEAQKRGSVDAEILLSIILIFDNINAKYISGLNKEEAVSDLRKLSILGNDRAKYYLYLYKIKNGNIFTRVKYKRKIYELAKIGHVSSVLFIINNNDKIFNFEQDKIDEIYCLAVMKKNMVFYFDNRKQYSNERRKCINLNVDERRGNESD